MTDAIDLLEFLGRGEPVRGAAPWPRFVVTDGHWLALASHLERTDWALLGLWASPGEVHAALYQETPAEIAIATVPCPDGRFASLARARPGAGRLERAIRDLFGLVPVGNQDLRPWLDHGQFPVRHPLSGVARRPINWASAEYAFLEAEGEALHQIPVGPVHAGIIEPGHFRFHCSGETVVRLEARLGYVHKGIEAAMEGKFPADAAKPAARISGDSTVAYGIAFARAAEAAAGTEAPARAHWLRALMAELERIANHIGDFGAICNDASFVLMHSRCGILRERVLRAAELSFGHRLMMDCVVPGGVARDLGDEGRRHLERLAKRLAREVKSLERVYDGKPSLLDRTVGTGIVSAALAHRLAAGGPIGRASARGFDARRMPAYPPYDALEFDVPVLEEGDVNARIWLRLKEIEQSLRLVEQLLAGLPEGPLASALPARAGEGMALVEGFRGDILVWMRLGPDGRVERCHARDPSWFQWPLLEAAIEGNIVADFPLCNKSFNCSYSGHDL
ncbi:MAG TPA: NADH-quinone oxidoreductase subunit C [Alphaproteobacteria bacterium]|nr:NADH-quinone oxidoreductase subunit C [Alphaproteobacteria bacterium]